MPHCSAACGSVRHQHRGGHRLEYAAGDAAEHKFTQPGVAIAAHDDEIYAGIGSMRKDHVGDIDVAEDGALDLDLKPVPREVLRHVGAFDFVQLAAFVGDDDDLDLFRLVIAALEDEQVNVLATVGRDNDPSVLAPLPDNARAERFVPQADVLPHCSAVIHHAGAGTMFGVLSHGLPSLALPQSADNFNNAALMQRAGAAQVLMPGEVTVPAVASKLRAVLESTDISERTRLIADEIRAMPSPDEMAARLAGQFASSPA